MDSKRRSNRNPARARDRSQPARRSRGSIADDLGAAILRGQFKPGATFSGQIEASRKLGVSRSVYREAIRVLSAKGLVESRPKTGTRVSVPGSWHLLDPEVLLWAFRDEPDQSLMWSLFELRMIIEPAAAELAARRRSYAQLALMQSALDTMRLRGLWDEEGRVADRVFHETLLQATGNAFLATLSAGISSAIHWTAIYKTRTKVLDDPMPEHERVFEAIRSGNPVEAKNAMTELVQIALEDTKMVTPAGKSAENPEGVSEASRALNVSSKKRRFRRDIP